MKQIFVVIGEIRNWIKSVVTDPKSRLYSSTILVAMGIITAYQADIPVTLNNLMRITGFSSMQIYRGTNTLTKHGLLDRKESGVWFWAVQVPQDIINMHPTMSNNSDVEELKAFITESFKNIRLDTPSGQAKIEKVVEEVKHFDPKQKRDPRTEKGPASMLGDAVLNSDE